MNQLQIPLDIRNQAFVRDGSIKTSIDAHLNMLLNTPQYSTPADPRFGFVLINMRFEIFDEHEGVVYNSGESDDVHGLMGMYDKKISGSSKNLNTFAAELKEVVVSYEKRLRDVAVTMTYIREERLVYVTVKGTVISTSEPYTYTSTISVWK